MSKFAALFPDFKGLSLAAKAAADLRRLMPTMATEGRRANNTTCDWLMMSEAGASMFSQGGVSEVSFRFQIKGQIEFLQETIQTIIYCFSWTCEPPSLFAKTPNSNVFAFGQFD